MTIRVPNHLLAFANGSESMKKLFEMAVDYYNHYLDYANIRKNGEYTTEAPNRDGKMVKVSFSDKEDQMNAALKKEILRVAKIEDISEFPLEVWSSHPTLRFASFAVVNALVDLILPDTLLENVGMFAEVRNLAWGDSAAFNVKPRDLIAITKVGNNKRTTEIHKNFVGQTTLSADPRALTVGVSLLGILTGKESLADLMVRVVRSMETEFAYDVYYALKTALDSVDATASTGLRVAGYSDTEFIRLAETVEAWNGGAKPICVGTLRAIRQVVPTSDVNYRYSFDDSYVKVGFIPTFNQVPLLVLPQIADYATPFGLRLANDRLWFISPSSQKLVKAVLEGATIARTDDINANADLSMSSTLTKRWGVGVITNAVAGVITL